MHTNDLSNSFVIAHTTRCDASNVTDKKATGRIMARASDILPAREIAKPLHHALTFRRVVEIICIPTVLAFKESQP